VALVFARGYTIGDRLLRPAMVAVAKPPQKSETSSDDSSSNDLAMNSDHDPGN
jgi:hypothetical protein